MRAEYDFSSGLRGKYADRFPYGLRSVVREEESGFLSLCPELDIASQGATVAEARANLAEAVDLFFETADEEEIRRRAGE